MLDMRRREEAEGESRIMGSGRREGFFGWEAMLEDGLLEEEMPFVVVELPVLLDKRLLLLRFLRKSSACLRTCEKSVGRIPRRTVFRSDKRRSPL